MAGKVVKFPTPARPPTRDELVRQIREFALSGDIRLDHPHVRQRMDDRKISMRQIIDVVNNGKAISDPSLDKYGGWRIKLKRLSAGRKVQVVVAVNETYFMVVTVI